MITFENALEIINEKIKEIPYPKEPKNLYAPIQYILALKGKKIRPALTLLACNLFQDDISKAIYPALAWEIFHNFTLMHDDVMDKAAIRRGKPTVHKVWNENTAMLSGDAMLILAYRTMTKSEPHCLKQLLDLFSATAAEICDGQQYDMEFETRMDVTEAEYLQMIRLKTAVMLGACLKTGGIVAGADVETLEQLYDFGINLGLAFQIRDDLLDVYGDPHAFGKMTGGDILCNKKTFFLVNVLEFCDENDKKNLLFRLSEPNFDPNEKIISVTAMYEKYGLKALAEDKITKLYDKAMRAFELIHVPTERKTVLYNFAEQLIARES